MISDNITARTFSHLSDALSYVKDQCNSISANTKLSAYTDLLRDQLSAYVLATNDTSITLDNYHSFVQLGGIAKYDDVMATVTGLQDQHRILSAADLYYGTNRPSTNGRFSPLLFDAAIQFLRLSDLTTSAETAYRSYGDNMEDGARPVALNLFFRACATMATIWGFFMAHEEPTTSHFVSAMQNIANGFPPFVPSAQVSPQFSRLGAMHGWNLMAACIDDEMAVRAASFAEKNCTASQVKQYFITAFRAAFSMTATVFYERVEHWTWNPPLTFADAEHSYDKAFRNFLSMTRAIDETDDSSSPAHNFSLQVNTTTVRMLRTTTTANAKSRSSEIMASHCLRPSNLRRIDGTTDPRVVQTTHELVPPGSSSQHQRTLADNHMRTTGDEQILDLTEEDAAARRQAEGLAAEQERCRRTMERRERNRARNRELTSTQLKERHNHDIRQLRHNLHGDADEFFELDDPDSDNEEIRSDRDIYLNCDADVNNIAAIDQRIDLEVLYEEVLSHCVDPTATGVPKTLLSILLDHGCSDNAWLRTFFNRNLSMFLLESTRATDALHYADHQKVMIHLETHFQLVTALFNTFPEMLRTRNPWPIVDQLDGSRWNPPHPNRFVLSMEKMNNTRLLTNLVCRSYSADHNVRRSLVNSFPGMTVCVGYFKRPHNPHEDEDPARSPLMLFMCRYITQDSDELEHDNEDGVQLDNVKVYLVCSRYWASTWTIGHGDVVTLIPFTTFVSVTRQLRAAHETYKLPRSLQRVLFGIPGGNYNAPLPRRQIPRTREQYEQTLRPIAEIRNRVDADSLSYVDSLPSTVCDESQKRAICTTLAEMGSLAEYSTSVSGIFGPPGTGKSTCICYAIAAILHHSKVGHIRPGLQPRSLLKNNTNVTFSNSDGIRILVTCPSNQGVDELAEKLKSGVLGKNGEMFYPKIVRIGRFNYPYGSLEDVSVQKLALQYDNLVYHVDDEQPRRNPTRQAQFALAEEAVIFLCTTSTAAGPMLKNIRATFSVVFIDEAAHASEQDTLCALAAGARYGQMQRLHVVLVGDSHQLKPVYISQHPATTLLNTHRDVYFRIGNTPISMQRQFVSMFERLYDRARCPFSWLTHQYRSHPDMARITMARKYADILIHPNDLSAYQKPYNQVSGLAPLQPLTLLDTRLARNRRERTAGAARGIHNELEVMLVENALFEVYRSRGNTYLASEIIVTTPYRSQLALLRQRLSEHGGFIARHPDLNVKVDTIDALQGSERSIVIMSLTRSGRDIGFLRDDNRLNVAFTRAKHLLYIIGDFHTMAQSNFVRSMYDRVSDGAQGTVLRFFRPSPHNVDHLQRQWAEENVHYFQL